MMMTDCRWFSVGVWVANECLEQPGEPEPLFKCDSPANAATVARIHNDLLVRAQQAEAAVAAHKCCPGADPTCPCQDGDACHYVEPHDGERQAVRDPRRSRRHRAGRGEGSDRLLPDARRSGGVPVTGSQRPDRDAPRGGAK